MDKGRRNSRRIVFGCAAWTLVVGLVLADPPIAGPPIADPPIADPPDPAAVASEVDRLVQRSLKAEKPSETASLPANLPRSLPASVADATFLRRVYLKVAGKLPSPDELTYFALDPDPRKRARVVDRLLRTGTASGETSTAREREAGDDWARNWARYWRDAFFARVQDRRALAQSPVFEEWLTEQFREDVGWDEIAREMVVATGDSSENGATGLIVAQQADPNNVAAETARLFMGIQIQCAQCHDHPYDDWRREQFHEMAAFFPRVRLERKKKGDKRYSLVVASFDARGSRRPGGAGFLDDPKPFFNRFDANGDGKLARSEMPRRIRPQLSRLLKIADKDKDNALTLEEIAAAPINRKRLRSEHFMPDLENPEAIGTQMSPRLFTSGQGPGEGIPDLERREALARYLTAAENAWFARAFVNRVWSEMVGTGFVMPIDDLGPDRDVAFPEVFDLLAGAFQKSGYSLRWLLGTIARTRAFGAEIELARTTERSPVACSMTRLRGDQLFDSLARVLGMPVDRSPRRGRMDSQGYRGRGGMRTLIARLFGHDPSTPQEDVAGTIPQALFLMNSRLIENAIRARGGSALGEMLDAGDGTESIIAELYLGVLSRPPTDKETAICHEYVEEAPDRSEALEDIYWSLLNSTEFLHHR